MIIEKKSGRFYILAAAVLWSFAGICSKLIPWGALSIACIRGLIAALTIGIANRKFTFKPTPSILLGAFGIFITSVLFMIANKITTAVNAIVIQYTAPVFVIILSAIFFKVKPKKLDIAIVFVTLIGISVFFIDHLEQGSILGDLLALLSGLSFALVFFANKMPGADSMSASYLGCLLHGLLIPFLFFDENIGNLDLKIALIVLFNGVIQLGMAYIFFSKGIKTTSAVSASIIAMLEPILNPIWVFLLINERPSPLSIIGAIIVIAAIGIYNAVNSQKATS